MCITLEPLSLSLVLLSLSPVSFLSCLLQASKEAASKRTGECGLCGKHLTNPAMVGGTGYVYCYPCLHAYVATHARCPATHVPASPDSLLRIYESTS